MTQLTNLSAIALYDLLGRQLRVLHNGTLAGESSHPFNVSVENLPNGAYFLRVHGDDFQITRRVVVTQ